jgi:cell division protein FtsW
LLFITLAFGVDINDAKRWISIPFVGISFQTSDLAKPMLIIYVAYMLAKTKDNLADFQKAYLPTILPVLLICGLIAPADLTTAIVLFLSCLILMFIGRTEVRYVLYTILFGIALFSLLVVIGDMFPDFVRVNTWTTRLNEFISNKEGGYQVQQAKVAIANGGWLGVGPSNGFQSAMIPSSHSDFIFAIILEEFGLLGAGVLIGMYMWLFMRCIRIITRSPKAFGSMLALGLALLIVIQAFINMSISVHLIPVGGVPLPLVSMGGTSTMFTCVMFGVILSVSRYIEMDKIGA